MLLKPILFINIGKRREYISYNCGLWWAHILSPGWRKNSEHLWNEANKEMENRNKAYPSDKLPK